MGLTLAWVVLPQNVFSQPKLKIGHYKGCSNTEMLIPIEIIDFEDINSLTLHIDVNAANVEYVSIDNINDAFSNGDFVGGDNVEGQISLNWFSSIAANVDSGLMCNIRVLLKQDTSNFNFRNNCEITQGLNVIEGVEYFNGLIFAMNTYAIDPVSQTLLEGSPATIKMLDLSEEISCQWQEMKEENWMNLEDTPSYSGVLTSQLSIESVTVEMNSGLFRCLLSNDVCSDRSSESELFVIPSGINELNGQGNSKFFLVYPNPVKGYLKCFFTSNIQKADLRLINLKGQIVLHRHLGNIISGEEISLKMANFSSGDYVLQLSKNNKLISVIKVIKQ